MNRSNEQMSCWLVYTMDRVICKQLLQICELQLTRFFFCSQKVNFGIIFGDVFHYLRFVRIEWLKIECFCYDLGEECKIKLNKSISRDLTAPNIFQTGWAAFSLVRPQTTNTRKQNTTKSTFAIILLNKHCGQYESKSTTVCACLSVYVCTICDLTHQEHTGNIALCFLSFRRQSQ